MRARSAEAVSSADQMLPAEKFRRHRHLQYLCEAQCERKIGIRSDSEHSWADLLPDDTKVEDDDDVYENQIDENSAKSAFSFTNAR